jgi:hypothetical protein
MHLTDSPDVTPAKSDPPPSVIVCKTPGVATPARSIFNSDTPGVDPLARSIFNSGQRAIPRRGAGLQHFVDTDSLPGVSAYPQKYEVAQDAAASTLGTDHESLVRRSIQHRELF